MFILNALCCISDPSEQSPTSISKIVIKAAPEHVSAKNNISSSENSDNSIDIQNINSMEQKTPTFNKVQTSNQTVRSDESCTGSDPCSLEEQLNSKFVSPSKPLKIQNDSKSTDNIQNSTFNFCGWDLAESDVKHWSIKDVLKFLGKIGLKKYHATFYENKIKGKDMITLSVDQLRSDLKMQQEDVRTINVYIQLLKEKSQREAKEKSLSRSFEGQKKNFSLYKYYSGTYSCRKILQMVKNPIMQEESEEQNFEKNARKQNLTTKDFYSSTNFSQLLTN